MSDDDAVRMLGLIIVGLSRAMEAARIEMIQNGPAKAMEWILNSLPDVWDGPEELAWNGTETAQEWFSRITTRTHCRPARCPISDGPREIGRVPYVTGFVRGGGAISRPLIVGTEDGKVTIGGAGEPWRLDVDARELFMRLWMQAEFAVEAEGACPYAAVTDGGWVPCALRRGHEGGHVFRVPEQAAAPGTGDGK